jgi:hypothetical protein
MPKKTNIIDLLDKLAPEVQKSFILCIQSITSDAQIAIITKALAVGNIPLAMSALRVGYEYFSPIDKALQKAYIEGGDWVIQNVKNLAKRKGNNVRGFFDGRNPRAEEFLAAQSSKLIADISKDQEVMIKNALTRNMVDGINPRTSAIELVGKVNKTTGLRAGGLIGLTNKQAEYVQNATRQLNSGDERQLTKYLTRKSRDKRFDGIVRRSIKSGEPLAKADITNITDKYRNKVLLMRGNTIARTELLASLHAAQDEGLTQLISSGEISGEQVNRKWDAANDFDTRSSHAFMDGQEDKDGLFTTGTGYQMKYCGDTSLGAPASEVINCRCRVVVNIDFIGKKSPAPVDAVKPKAKKKDIQPFIDLSTVIQLAPKSKTTPAQMNAVLNEQLSPQTARIIDKYPKPNKVIQGDGVYYSGEKKLVTGLDRQTFSHEYGHHLDHMISQKEKLGEKYGVRFWSEMGLADAVIADKASIGFKGRMKREEKDELLTKLKDELYETRTERFVRYKKRSYPDGELVEIWGNRTVSELRFEGANGLSDIIDGFSNGVFRKNYHTAGHGAAYWKSFRRYNSKLGRNTEGIGLEAFANLFSIQNKPEALKWANKNFPALTKAFNAKLKEMENE